MRKLTRSHLACLGTFACLSAVSQNAWALPTTQPDFGPNVVIIDSTTVDAQKQLDDIYATQQRAEFNDHRYAVLFQQGDYHLDVRLGYYTQVLGLGTSPEGVKVHGAIESLDSPNHHTALVNFWRAAENLSVYPIDNKPNVWAVSQATALRRVHIMGDLHLWESGYSSGGFMADCLVDGTVASGSQQQWIARNSGWFKWDGGAFNMVFVGDLATPEGEWPQKPYTTIAQTPLIREKPYLVCVEDYRYFVMVPPLAHDVHGITWMDDNAPKPRAIPISEFYIAHAERDTAASLNNALASGKHLLLTPGIYKLDEAIRVTHEDTVVLGLGYATLMPTKGTPAMAVDDGDGITIAGLLFDAGEIESPTLLEVGPARASRTHAEHPIALFDIFARTGGAAVGKAKAFVTINSSNVIGDNFWLWRADHGTGAAWDQNTNANGLIVNGNDVTMYGLFVEHCQAYQTLWNGNGGRVYFYQSEMPYDPPNQAAWGNDEMGFPSYKVADTVTTHEAHGLGVYCVFKDGAIVAQNAIEAPVAPGVQLQNMISVRFGGKPDSGIAHVLNGRGGDAIKTFSARLEK